VTARSPDLKGPVGEAWKMPVPEGHTNVAFWYVHRSGAALWTWWRLTVVHLRPVEGLPPAVLTLAGASHEFVFAALDTFAGGSDPEAAPPDLDDTERRSGFLSPLDYVGQFAGLTDAQAARVLELVARAVVFGVVPASDSDRRAWWGGAMQRTVMHEIAGHCSVPGGVS